MKYRSYATTKLILLSISIFSFIVLGRESFALQSRSFECRNEATIEIRASKQNMKTKNSETFNIKEVEATKRLQLDLRPFGMDITCATDLVVFEPTAKNYWIVPGCNDSNMRISHISIEPDANGHSEYCSVIELDTVKATGTFKGCCKRK